MDKHPLQPPWPVPDVECLERNHVVARRLNPDADIDDLYELSHGKEEYKTVWRFMTYGPFAGKEAMHAWLRSIAESRDPLFFTIFSKDHRRRVGMYAIMNISTQHGRAELGNIWYSPLVQKTIVNTEVTYLFLSYLFDDLHYRRVEWKCDDRNEASKYAALRLGFSYEGLFRQHMVVKGENRDTAWFAMIDREWPERKKNFQRYFDHPGLVLRKLHGEHEHLLLDR